MSQWTVTSFINHTATSSPWQHRVFIRVPYLAFAFPSERFLIELIMLGRWLFMLDMRSNIPLKATPKRQTNVSCSTPFLLGLCLEKYHDTNFWFFLFKKKKYIIIKQKKCKTRHILRAPAATRFLVICRRGSWVIFIFWYFLIFLGIFYFLVFFNFFLYFYIFFWIFFFFVSGTSFFCVVYIWCTEIRGITYIYALISWYEYREMLVALHWGHTIFSLVSYYRPKVFRTSWFSPAPGFEPQIRIS